MGGSERGGSGGDKHDYGVVAVLAKWHVGISRLFGGGKEGTICSGLDCSVGGTC